jgi:hypothetical protein
MLVPPAFGVNYIVARYFDDRTSVKRFVPGEF